MWCNNFIPDFGPITSLKDVLSAVIGQEEYAGVENIEGRMVRYVKILQSNSILTNSIENEELVLSKEGNSFRPRL